METGTKVTPYLQRLMAVRDNPAASTWLKTAMLVLDSRDPVDALRDSTELRELQAQRCVDIGLIEDAQCQRKELTIAVPKKLIDYMNAGGAPFTVS